MTFFASDKFRYWTIGLSVVVAAVLFGLVYWQGSHRPESSIITDAPVLVMDRARVLADRASLLTLPTEDVTVFVPGGSFEVGGSVSMVDSEPNLFTEMAGEQLWDRPRIVNIEYYNPMGKLVTNATTGVPVEICFTFTPDMWREYMQDKSKFAIQFYDDQPDPGKWVTMPVTDQDQQRSLCAKSSHLTLFALAIQQPMPIGITGATPEATPNGPYTP